MSLHYFVKLSRTCYHWILQSINQSLNQSINQWF